MVSKEAQPSEEPRTTQTNQRQEQREGQPRSRVWDVLERKVLLHAPDAKNDLQKYPKIWLERASVVNRQEEVLRKNGSDYDRAVLDLIAAATSPLPGTARTLTLEQFKHLRSDFRELSAEEIVEQKRQMLQEIQQLRGDVHQIFPQMDS